ncbi:MAG: YbhB/YbcL family Raf kinase inhibitor-like protein [Candidatus Lokiarchaeota archaeon]|nr:YbhB/YbcL family Raf kinase inhibitor-like protein [Candidatus Lokiarchaeota archaeon]
MKLRSDCFKESALIPSEYTCDGADKSPHLEWEDVPENTKSFALIVDDPDAPVGTWVHWLVCDITPDARKVVKGQIPDGGKQVKNDFGKLDYGGPCPPSGTHRYFFKLYALDVPKLSNVSESNFYELVDKHKIEEAVLIGKYKRNR